MTLFLYSQSCYSVSGYIVSSWYIIFTDLFFLYILYTESLCRGNYNLLTYLLSRSREHKSDYGCLWIYLPGPWIYHQDYAWKGIYGFLLQTAHKIAVRRHLL